MIDASGAQIAAAREWAEDCTWKDDPRDASDAEIVHGINRHYDGGWDGFLRDIT